MPRRLAATLLAVLCLLSLAAAAAAQEPAAPPEVPFIDSSGFDRKLSSALSSAQREVHVVFPAAITLNNIPERLDKWLSKVEKNGGSVEIEAEPEPGRSFISEIFSLFVKAYEAIEEAVIYRPAKDYNVVIRYRARTGLVTKAIFVRKGMTPSAACAANATAPQ